MRCTNTQRGLKLWQKVQIREATGFSPLKADIDLKNFLLTFDACITLSFSFLAQGCLTLSKSSHRTFLAHL